MKTKLLSIAILSFVLMLMVLSASCVAIANAEGKKYALVIGVENYEHMDKKDYALNDAKEVADQLTKEGWDVTKLEDATKEQIVAALETLALNAKPEDQVIIYFSGHTNQCDDGPEESDGVDEFLATKDCNPNKGDYGINDDDLGAYILLIDSQHIAIIMETCYAGGYFEICKHEGCLVLGASKESEKAWSWSELENGIYTNSLLTGLEAGWSLEAAHSWAALVTEEYAEEKLGQLQEPDMRDNYEGEYIVATSGGVGGIVIPVDKFALLAPYIGFASTILVATVATAAFANRVKRRKEKQ